MRSPRLGRALATRIANYHARRGLVRANRAKVCQRERVGSVPIVGVRDRKDTHPGCVRRESRFPEPSIELVPIMSPSLFQQSARCGLPLLTSHAIDSGANGRMYRELGDSSDPVHTPARWY
jgi:hypothetical protein